MGEQVMETPTLKSQRKDALRQAADEEREPTKEELMEDIRQGLRDVRAGYEGQDAMDFLDELRQEIYGKSGQSETNV